MEVQNDNKPKMKTALFGKQEKRILICIVFFVIITRILPAFRTEAQIYSGPYTEDGFYLFTCAEHIANGDGFTCDGKQFTNGVQPLIVIFYVPLFLIAGINKLLALKLSFILVALFDSISTLLIASVVRILQKEKEIKTSAWLSPPIIAAILWASLYSVFVHTGNGLETGLYSAMLLAVLYSYGKLTRNRGEGDQIKIRRWIALGVLLGITVLARIDAVFFVIAIVAYEVYIFRAKGLLQGAIISFSAFIISSPWWWYNYHYFGNLMPQSGIAESMGVPLRINIQDFAHYMGELLTLFFFLPDYKFSAWVSFGWLLLILACLFFFVKRYRPEKFLKSSYMFSSLFPYFFFCGSLCIIYVFFFGASYFFPRYFQPLRILWLMTFAGVTPEIFRTLRNFYTRKKIFLLTCITLFAVSFAAFSVYKYRNLFVITEPSSFYLTGKWALQHPNERIGMEQSGTAGFIASNVVNLDGKVNFAALRAQRKLDIGVYIESEKLDYIADWREYSEGMSRSAAVHGGKFEEVDSIGNIIIFKRVQ